MTACAGSFVNISSDCYVVSSMENYDEMVRAMGYFTYRYGKIDWVESNNEYWLSLDARLRQDFHIMTGITIDRIADFQSKSRMKHFYAPGRHSLCPLADGRQHR